MKYIQNQDLMSQYSEAYWFLYRQHFCDFKNLFFLANISDTSQALLYILAQDGNLYRLTPMGKNYQLECVHDTQLYMTAVLEARHTCAEYPTISHALLIIERNTKFYSNNKIL